MSDLSPSPVEECLATLREQIGLAEVEAAQDLLRMDEDHERRKRDRWDRMVLETRHLRAQVDQITKLLAEVEMCKAHPLMVISK